MWIHQFGCISLFFFELNCEERQSFRMLKLFLSNRLPRKGRDKIYRWTHSWKRRTNKVIESLACISKGKYYSNHYSPQRLMEESYFWSRYPRGLVTHRANSSSQYVSICFIRTRKKLPGGFRNVVRHVHSVERMLVDRGEMPRRNIWGIRTGQQNGWKFFKFFNKSHGSDPILLDNFHGICWKAYKISFRGFQVSRLDPSWWLKSEKNTEQFGSFSGSAGLVSLVPALLHSPANGTGSFAGGST